MNRMQQHNIMENDNKLAKINIKTFAALHGFNKRQIFAAIKQFSDKKMSLKEWYDFFDKLPEPNYVFKKINDSFKKPNFVSKKGFEEKKDNNKSLNSKKTNNSTKYKNI